jgi:hypothetical protein
VLVFVTDTTLQWIGILPETGARKFELRESLLALSYHLGYTILGGYTAARLAPRQPIAHALALGALGVAVSALGLVAIIVRDLAPTWYAWVLTLLSLPAT